MLALILSAQSYLPQKSSTDCTGGIDMSPISLSLSWWSKLFIESDRGPALLFKQDTWVSADHVIKLAVARISARTYVRGR